MTNVVMKTVSIRVRAARGGTPDIQVLAKRGMGGVRLPIGGGRWEMMTLGDAALTDQARASIVANRQAPQIKEIDAAKSAAVSSAFDLGMLAVPGTKLRAMRDEVQISMFRQFVKETNYQPEEGSDDADNFLRVINGQREGDMGWLNNDDCVAFIGWARGKTGSNTLRMPTGTEWQVMAEVLKGRLTGTQWERLADDRYQFFRSLHVESRNDRFPEFRVHNNGLRLVEDNPEG